mmetsp:Transcript_22329/g.51150  ORF Transcript_22329/g.51150 Transcript_22329/m.51150 type:complete len:1362 (-) Transcript_22329:80-4165(-)
MPDMLLTGQSPPQSSHGASDRFEVRLSHAFGSVCSSREFCGGALFGDPSGDHIVHAVGRRIALQHLASGETSFVPVENSRVEAVSACAMSRDRSLLAVCERCSTPPVVSLVSVYNLSRPGTKPVRLLEELANSVGKVVAAAFSVDAEARRMVLASAFPVGLLVLLDWRENTVLGRCAFEDQVLSPASRVAICPEDLSVVSASGDNYVQLWKVTKGRLMPMPQLDGLASSSEIADHSWIMPHDGNIAACCSTSGCVFILSTVRSTEDADKLQGIIHIIDVPFPSALAEARHAQEMPLRVYCMDKGFLLGGSRGGLSLWVCDQSVPPSRESTTSQRRRSYISRTNTTKLEMQNKPKHIHTHHTRSSDVAVTSVDVVPEEESGYRILLGFQDASIGITSMDVDAVSREHEACIILAGGFHSGPITSLDMARQRPIFATACRKDGTVRVWSYATKHCEVCWESPHEEITSVAVHPNGYCVAISTISKIRFFQVLIGQLKQYRELSIRAVRHMRFSTDGHVLAASQGRTLLVFSSQSMERLATLRTHGQIIALHWLEEQLLTVTDEGQFARWNTTTWEKLVETQASGLEFSAISAEHAGQSFANVLDTSSMRMVLAPFEGAERAGEGLEVPGDVRMSSLCFIVGPRHSALFAAASTGSVRLHSAPMASLRQFEDIHLHAGAVASLCLSSDSRTMVTAGVDGAIFLFEIEGLAGSDAPLITQDDDFVMISQGEVQRMDEELEVLTSENANLKELLAETAARLEGESRSLVNEARQKDHEAIKRLRHKYEVLQQEMTTKERECIRQMKAMETHHLQVADKIEQHYDRKVVVEAERQMGLEREVAQLEDKVKAMQAESQRLLEMLRQRHKQELRQRTTEKDVEVHRHKDLLQFSQLRFDTMLDQEGMEHELEVSEQKRVAQKELEQQMQVEYKLKKEQDTLLRGLDMMEKDRDRVQKEQIDSRALISNLEMQKEQLTQMVSFLKEERRDREVTLRDKEMEIGSHKVKVNTLKKFKHVLDFRLREVTLSLQPKDQMIKQLNTQLHAVEEEFDQQHGQKKILEDMLEKKNEQERELLVERVRLQDAVKHREHTIENFREALYTMVNEEVDARRWPGLFKALYEEHFNHDALRHDKEMELPMKETRRQMNVMEGKVTHLMAKNKRTEVVHSAKVRQQTEENSQMIEDMTKLRAANKVLQAQVTELEFQLQQAEFKRAQQLKALEDSSPKLQRSESLEDGAHSPMVVLKAVDSTAASQHAKRLGLPRQQRPAGSSAKTAPARALEQAKRLKTVREAAEANSRELQLQADRNQALREQVEMLIHAKEGPDEMPKKVRVLAVPQEAELGVLLGSASDPLVEQDTAATSEEPRSNL